MKDECAICFNEYKITNKLKYKCSVCDKKICNNCFLNYIKDNKTCVFCRNILVISTPVYNTPYGENENNNGIYRKKNLKCVFIFSFFFIYLVIICNNIAPIKKIDKDLSNTTNLEYNISRV